MESVPNVNTCWLCSCVCQGGRPAELSGLRMIEEMLICQVLPVASIFTVGNGHDYYRGHQLSMGQDLKELYHVLPRLGSELPITVVFRRGTKPGSEPKFTDLSVRKQKVQDALAYLRTHNPLYRKLDEKWFAKPDDPRWATLPEDGMMPGLSCVVEQSNHDEGEGSGAKTGKADKDESNGESGLLERWNPRFHIGKGDYGILDWGSGVYSVCVFDEEVWDGVLEYDDFPGELPTSDREDNAGHTETQGSASQDEPAFGRPVRVHHYGLHVDGRLLPSWIRKWDATQRTAHESKNQEYTLRYREEFAEKGKQSATRVANLETVCTSMILFAGKKLEWIDKRTEFLTEACHRSARAYCKMSDTDPCFSYAKCPLCLPVSEATNIGVASSDSIDTELTSNGVGLDGSKKKGVQPAETLGASFQVGGQKGVTINLENGRCANQETVSAADSIGDEVEGFVEDIPVDWRGCEIARQRMLRTDLEEVVGTNEDYGNEPVVKCDPPPQFCKIDPGANEEGTYGPVEDKDRPGPLGKPGCKSSGKPLFNESDHDSDEDELCTAPEDSQEDEDDFDGCSDSVDPPRREDVELTSSCIGNSEVPVSETEELTMHVLAHDKEAPPLGSADRPARWPNLEGEIINDQVNASAN